MRLLLTHVRGPQSFEDILVVNGKPCETFKEAAIQHGLLRDDNECENCLTEALTFIKGKGLRSIFMEFLIHGSVQNPLQIWNKFKEHFSADCVHRHRVRLSLAPSAILPEQHRAQAEEETLRELQLMLEPHNRELKDFGLPIPPSSRDTLVQEELLKYDVDHLKQKVNSALTLLTPSQLKVYNTIIDAIKADIRGVKSNKTFFIDSPGGSGKSFLLEVI